MRARWRCLAFLVAAGCLPSCRQVLGFEDLQPETSVGGDSNGGASASQEACAKLEAPAGDGSPMLKLARANGSCFLMDEHEVTFGQYKVFQDAPHDSPSLECAWSTPDVDQDCVAGSTRLDIESEDTPAVCVHQCNAKAYCEWAGKDLCHGDVGFPSDAGKDDWYSACSNQGKTQYPYGNTTTPDLCNIQPTANGRPWAVDVGTACVDDAGVRDLLGNVWEWVGGPKACKRFKDANDECLIHGSSFVEQHPTCGDLLNPTRGTVTDSIGFRCCAYPE